jgi:hypothetical protein
MFAGVYDVYMIWHFTGHLSIVITLSGLKFVTNTISNSFDFTELLSSVAELSEMLTQFLNLYRIYERHHLGTDWSIYYQSFSSIPLYLRLLYLKCYDTSHKTGFLFRWRHIKEIFFAGNSHI